MLSLNDHAFVVRMLRVQDNCDPARSPVINAVCFAFAVHPFNFGRNR
jgi:hypothetical protein